MGNRASGTITPSEPGDENIGNRVWLYLYRTWEVIVSSERRTKSRATTVSRKSELSEITTEFESQYSICSCSQCQKDDGFSSGCYRFTKIVCREVVTMLTPYMQEAKRKSDLRIETKVLLALRFFASGSYQEITGSNIYLAISQSSVSRAIHETCDALTSPDVFHQFIKFPQNLVELRQLRQSDIFDTISSMAPNSEDSIRIEKFQTEETVSKEKQRPPIYNPEDYALSLKKWGKKSPNGCGVSLYANPATADSEGTRTVGHSFRDYRNPMLISSGSEMTLRQFGTVSELLNKLKSDLRLAYPSFAQEFVAEPLDGISLLLDLLRAVQVSQSTNPQAFPGSNHTTGKVPPAIQRRALLDELSCLQCLSSCCSRYSDAIRRLTASSAGLFTLAICIMSNVNKSRILALQLLAKVCDESLNGHTAVSEALSTLRLRFGEPVRFRFLVGILNSTGAQGELLAAGMKFINSFLASAPSSQKRLYIQAEMEQAGFDIASMKKNIVGNSDITDKIFEEFQQWERNHIDVETLTIRADSAEKENDSLRDKILLLERKVQILQEEKTILMSLEQCLKDRCNELQCEVNTLKSSDPVRKDYYINQGDLCKTDDEGISSSERSSSPEGDIEQKQASYDLYKAQCCTLIPPTCPKQSTEEARIIFDDEETTIEEVMEEFQNIINDAESENFKKDQKITEQQRKQIEEAQVAGKIQMELHPPRLDDFSIVNERANRKTDSSEVPRKSKSLVHLFIPTVDYEYENINNKGLFFGNMYTSDDDTDSSLSNYRWRISNIERQPAATTYSEDNNKVNLKIKDSYQHMSQENHLHKFDHNNSKNHGIKRPDSFRIMSDPNPSRDDIPSSLYSNSHITVSCQKNHYNYDDFNMQRMKSKSLDRIDDGLESMVDIVVTDPRTSRYAATRTKSDSGNATLVSRSISHVFINPPREFRNRVNSYSEEKQKMFLPSPRDQFEVPYYFPRVQEKLSSTNSAFLIKRGHTNAGLYSGQVYKENIVSRKESRSTKDSLPIFTSVSKSSSRVTDLPSGLY